jgi:very-short-patch-repair endonuclease
MITLYCNNGHKFTQKANNHLNGTGCPKCNRFNVKESKLLEFIQNNTQTLIKTSDRKILKGMELDIYLPELKLGFEFNGLYWHSEIFKDRKYHLKKTEICNNQGIELLHIWEDDWMYKQEIIKSIILNRLEKTPNKIFARKCQVRFIEDNKIVRDFLNKNHIQGFVGSKIKLGLYHNNELVSLMTFGNLRKSLGQTSRERIYELLRFCNKLNTSVVGGASKLFRYFIDNFIVDEIISYSDYSRSKGNMYQKIGFNLEHKSDPNYYYVIDGVRKHRFGFRKDKLVNEGYDINKTETQIMSERGYYKIFDCGMQKWVYKI